MAEVTLNAANRFSLFHLQRTAALREQTTARLETGLRVRQATDAPAAYYQSQGLSERLRDLLQGKDEISQARSAVDAAQAGLDGIETLARQLRGVALSVQGGTAEQRQAAAEQFDTIRGQIDALANDTNYGGIALIAAQPGKLDVNLDGEGATDLTIQGRATDTASLGIGSAVTDHNNFATDADIAAALSEVSAAVATVRGTAADFGSEIAALNIRETFNANLANTLEAGAVKLVNADLNAESARLLATQVREQLGLEAPRISSNSVSLLANFI